MYLKLALLEMEESNQKILSSIHHNPSVTIHELQDMTGLSESGVKKVIRQLKAEGLIQRIDGDKGGHWKVNID